MGLTGNSNHCHCPEIIINQKLNMRTTCTALFVILLSTIEIHGGAVSREKRAPQYDFPIYIVPDTPQSECVNQIKRKPICSREGLCMEVAQNKITDHIRVYCYDQNDAQIDVEWTVEGKWAGKTDNFEGKYTDCMFLDWGHIQDNDAHVYCTANNHPKGWTQIDGSVTDNGLTQFN